ncbi:hypothetical protein [Amycolatopsis sp. NPDC004079]|uniref:hypothetical protein n=1 Tax=Amycolatopsis sp. NPDC004079 TaxID=3154549 RepID=UPI0033B0E9E9
MNERPDHGTSAPAVAEAVRGMADLVREANAVRRAAGLPEAPPDELFVVLVEEEGHLIRQTADDTHETAEALRRLARDARAPFSRWQLDMMKNLGAEQGNHPR